MLFSKAPSCLQTHGGPIELPEDLDQVDAEAELAVVIGKPGRRIPRERAREHIAGYTCFNDVSDRAAQYADKQFFRGKSIDTGGPCGPWIVTPDELPDLAHGLDVTCRWNGTVMQHSNTEQLIFPVDELIAHASRNMTLMPGDIISTGTPGGVGVFRDPPVFLKPGDYRRDRGPGHRRAQQSGGAPLRLTGNTDLQIAPRVARSCKPHLAGPRPRRAFASRYLPVTQRSSVDPGRPQRGPASGTLLDVPRHGCRPAGQSASRRARPPATSTPWSAPCRPPASASTS